MRFALLGVDVDTLPLAEAIAGTGQHQIVWYSESDTMGAALSRLAPAAEPAADWESLLTGQVADAVVVGRAENEDLRADQLRKLVTAAIPLLIAHPAHSSMLVCYELEMIRQSSGCPILPYHGARFSPALARLVDWAGGHQGYGAVQQVLVERWLDDPSPSGVRQAFARDIDLAGVLAGDLTRLAAMAPSSEPAAYANLGVQLSGPANALVRWSIGGAGHAAGARLTVIGDRGRAILELPADRGDARLELLLPQRSVVEEFRAADSAREALERFARLTRGELVRPTWSDACRAVELADSIQRSLEKGRTVELHHEDYSEESTFKGTMTSLGCGLLGVSLLVLVLGVVGAGFRVPLADLWPFALLAVLVLFLCLQLLRFAFPPKESN
jgi:myo-inositol 2-dehydrogenase/D-chiro-inositol 1-dehydrogenase